MKKWETIREFIMITFATVIVAAAVFFFLMPSHVSVGSISGLAIVLGNFVPLKISAITFILNMFLLVLGFLLIGREFGAKKMCIRDSRKGRKQKAAHRFIRLILPAQGADSANHIFKYFL